MDPTEKHHVADEEQSSTKAREDGDLERDGTWTGAIYLWLPIALMCLLVWLDEGILATAIPSISDEFDSFDQVAWYGPAYLFGLCAAQLPFGRAYRDLPTRSTYLKCLLLFEVASIIQATAPSSVAFIIGRVLAGIGGSGVLAGSLVLCSEEMPESKVVYFMGSFSWVHAVGSIAGPIIGGSITSSSLTWRWCFWLNPILSTVVVIPIIFLWRGRITRGTSSKKTMSTWEFLRSFDWIGMASFIAATALLLLALQFGGSMYTWSDGRTIGTFVTAVVLYATHGLWEWYAGESAMVPTTILANWVIIGGLAYMAVIDAAQFILTYGIPLWFQAIQEL